jgi:hypothetical protein
LKAIFKGGAGANSTLINEEKHQEEEKHQGGG